MNDQFLHFKRAFHRIMPPFTLPPLSLSHTPPFQHFQKWMKLFSAGVIIYSTYYYLKHNSSMKLKYSFFSYFYHIKKLFSKRIENRSKKNNVALEVKELPEHVKYDGGWYTELDDLKQSLVSESESESESASASASASIPVTAVFTPDASLREITPRGEIVMYYDAEKKTFNYYSNSKNIPYSTLDAVARKYVCLHKDPSIYIDLRDEIQKGREKRIRKDKDDKLKLEINKNKNGILPSPKKSLFAAFKNYKTGQTGQTGQRNALASVPVPVPKSLNNCDGNIKVEELVVIKNNINKFIYKGTLEQYDFDLKCYKDKQQSRQTFQPDNENRVDNSSDADYIRLTHEKQDLSYADFKKRYSH